MKLLHILVSYMYKYTHMYMHILQCNNVLYKAEKPSVCPFVCLHFWHTDNSAVSALIKWKLLEMKAVSLENKEFILRS